MPRAIREVLLIVAVASLMPFFIGVAVILAGYSTGVERGYELWFLAVLVTMAFFPLAGTAGVARLISACVQQAHSWRLAGATGAALMLVLITVGLLLQNRKDVASVAIWIAVAVVTAGAAAAMLTLANNWFDRRRNRQT